MPALKILCSLPAVVLYLNLGCKLCACFKVFAAVSVYLFGVLSLHSRCLAPTLFLRLVFWKMVFHSDGQQSIEQKVCLEKGSFIFRAEAWSASPPPPFEKQKELWLDTPTHYKHLRFLLLFSHLHGLNTRPRTTIQSQLWCVFFAKLDLRVGSATCPGFNGYCLLWGSLRPLLTNLLR